MRNEYNTRQKRDLIRYLKEHPMDHFSLDDIVYKIHEAKLEIGRSTIYRYLEALSEQGSVRKYQNAQGLSQYQFVEDEEKCHEHFHMMCRECGRLMHVDCDLMNNMADHIEMHHGFRLDPMQTILVGTCAACSGKEKKSDGIVQSGTCNCGI